MINDATLTEWSHSLAAILRHKAYKRGIAVREDGFVRVAELLYLKRFDEATLQGIAQVVATSRHLDGRPRFELRQNKDHEWFVRAMSHHSMPGVDPGAQPSDLHAFGGASQAAPEHSGDHWPNQSCAICTTELLGDPPLLWECYACGETACYSCMGECRQPGCRQWFCDPCLREHALACFWPTWWCVVCWTKLPHDPPPWKCHACGKAVCYSCMAMCYEPECRQWFCSYCLHRHSCECSSH